MKKIFLPLTLLLGACSNSGTTTTTTTPEPAAAETAAASSDTTAATAPAAAPDTDSSAVDAASGATSVPNETLFNGILVLSPQHRATVTLTMGGSVRSTTLLPGAYVKQGDVLATLENPKFITLQQTYLDSHAQYEYLRTEYLRQQTLSREEASSQKRYQQSRAEYLSMRSRMEAAAAQLALLGMDTTRLLTSGIVPFLEVKAPISGYAADVQMNVGRHFDVGEPLCEIVDKSEMMLRLTVYEKDLAYLAPGAQVEFRVNGLDNQAFRGTVTMIGQQVNNENRSIDVYVRIADRNAQFRPGMYATARIRAADADRLLHRCRPGSLPTVRTGAAVHRDEKPGKVLREGVFPGFSFGREGSRPRLTPRPPRR